MQINLADVTGKRVTRNLSGKERGLAARAQLKIDLLDDSPNTIDVVIPTFVDTIAPSFFQGLFSQSIQKLKGKEAFLAKYHFIADEGVMRWIDIGIRNSTSSRSALI